LFDEAEKLGSPRRLRAIEIDAISVASGRDDLQAKAGETHAKERCKPEYTILQSEAVYQEPGRDKYGPSPNRFETNFWGWVGSSKLMACTFDDVSHTAQGDRINK
jgi:hypothetical protein